MPAMVVRNKRKVKAEGQKAESRRQKAEQTGKEKAGSAARGMHPIRGGFL
jgi:hypothetical protein